MTIMTALVVTKVGNREEMYGLQSSTGSLVSLASLEARNSVVLSKLESAALASATY